MVAILDHHKVELTGRHVAVVGRSTVVGKPAAHLLLNKNATVTICHSRTKDLAAVTSAADVVVVAVGRAGLITAEHVRPGAVVVDVGTNPTDDGGLVGDVDASSVTEKAGALTPRTGRRRAGDDRATVAAHRAGRRPLTALRTSTVRPRGPVRAGDAGSWGPAEFDRRLSGIKCTVAPLPCPCRREPRLIAVPVMTLMNPRIAYGGYVASADGEHRLAAGVVHCIYHG